jgi:hypothetical protein
LIEAAYKLRTERSVFNMTAGPNYAFENASKYFIKGTNYWYSK